MRKNLLVLGVILFFLESVIAQTNHPVLSDIDSLTHLFETAPTETAQLAVIPKDKNLSWVKQPESALALFQKALTLALRQREHSKTAYLMHNLGYLYQYGFFNEKEAFNWYQKALDRAEAQQDFYLCAETAYNISEMYGLQELRDKMLVYLQKAVAYSDKTSHPKVIFRVALLYYYATLGHLDEALALNKEIVALEQKMGFSSYHKLLTYGYTLIALKQKPEEKALLTAYKNKLRSMIDTVSFNINDDRELVNVAFICLDIDRPELTIKYCKRFLQLPNYIKKGEVFALQYLAQAYERLGNYPLSIAYYKQYIDKELALTKTSLIDKAGQKMLVLEAEKNALVQQHEINKHKTMALAGLIVAILLALGVVVVYRFYKREQQTKRELAQLNTTKDRLFALLSHDLLSPLANFKNILSLTEWGLLTQSEFTHISKDMTAKAHNLHNMFENVLHWALSQMQGITARREWVKIADVINEQIDFLRPIANSKHIEIQDHIPPDWALYLDKNHLALIIRNLLQNALKFTHPKGCIRFKAEKTAPSGHPTEGGYVIEIEDNGIGMEAEVLQKLFKIDENTNRKGTQQEAGTGLGLILTKELVELNQGRISVYSTRHKGTTCRLTF